MPRLAKPLSALEVKRLHHPGEGGNVTFTVGEVSGLLLQITPSGSRSWLLRVTVGGRRREMGLGPYPEVTLASARERARELKDKVRRGIDPIEEGRALRAQLVARQKRNKTFADAVDDFLSGKLMGFKNPKHRQQWENTLRTYAVPHLGKMTLEDITVQDVVRVLDPIWLSKNETASRLRSRIEAVLSWATVKGHRSGDNPARWVGNLKELLPAPGRVSKGEHQPALRFEDAPRWYRALLQRDGIGSLALEFTALTASRSAAVRGATWDEVDFSKKLWVIPAHRMKTEKEHRVPLSTRALELLASLPRFKDNPLVFAAPRGGMLSDMTLSATMKRIHEADIASDGPGFLDRASKRPAVPHGLRSTFRDWVGECTNFPREMAEIALAHQVGNAVEAAYRRGHMVEKRRKMMNAWAIYLQTE